MIKHRQKDQSGLKSGAKTGPNSISLLYTDTRAAMPMDSHCRSISVSCGRLKLRFNPVVTILSALIIWGFVIWCMVIPVEALAELSTWKYWVTQKWTWLYVGTQDVWAVFIIILYFSKYSKLKLGKDDEKPEFGDTAYFTMLFAAGIGIGLFYFGVAEPVNHYNPGEYGNRFWGRYVDMMFI